MTKAATLPPAPPPRYDVTLLTPQDLHLFNEGTHNQIYDKLGAHIMSPGGEAGTCFGVWAPNAKEVSVMGSFNGWNPHSHPGADVQLVNRDRRAQRMFLPALLHPLLIAPLVVQIPNTRRRSRRLLVVKTYRVGLVSDVSMLPRTDVILVQCSFADAGDESFPYPGTPPRL